MNENKKRPTGLIQNKKLEPKQTAESTTDIELHVKKTRGQKKSVAKNQEANIKVSSQSKNEFDILMKLTDHKFGYELLDSLIDYYVETALDNDKKRAFKTLSSL